MAEINKIPQFNVAEFLAKRREASSRETTGTNYVDLLRQGSAQNQGYSTSGSFAGVQQPQQPQQPGIMPGQRAESAIGNNYVGTQGNLWNATVGTLEDISQNILGGVFGVAEGLIDALAGVGGAVVGGLGGKTEGFEDFIKNRWSDNAAAFAPRVFYGIFNPETYTSMVDDISSGNFNFGEFIDGKYSASKYSIINAQPGRTSFVEDVSQGVGQLLPLVGLTILTGGVGGAAAAGGTAATTGGVLTAGAATKIGITAMSISAAGGGVESALNEGYDYGTSLLYGTATGAIEAATEVIGGRLLKGLGKVTGVSSAVGSSTLAKRLLSTSLGRAARAGLEEGFEEVVAEVGGSFLDWAILQKDDAFKNKLTFDNLSRTFATSFVTSGITNITFGQRINVNGKTMDRAGSEQFLNFYTFEQLNQPQSQKVSEALNSAFQPLIQNNVLEADVNGKYEAFVPGVGEVKFNVSETSVIKDYEINIDGKITETQLKSFEKSLNDYKKNQNANLAWEKKLDAEYTRNKITQEDLDAENLNKNIPESLQTVENEIKDFLQSNKNINVDQNGKFNFVGKGAAKKLQTLQSLILRKKTLQYHKEVLEAKFKKIDDVAKKLKDNNWKNLKLTETVDANGKTVYSPINIDTFSSTNRTNENAALVNELDALKNNYPEAVSFVSGVGNAGQNVTSLFDKDGNLLYYADKYFENPRLTVKQITKTDAEIAQNVVSSFELAESYATEKLSSIVEDLNKAFDDNQLEVVPVPKNGKIVKAYVKRQLEQNVNLNEAINLIKKELGSKAKLKFDLTKTSFSNPVYYQKFSTLVDSLYKLSRSLNTRKQIIVDLQSNVQVEENGKIVSKEIKIKDISELNENFIKGFTPSAKSEFFNVVKQINERMFNTVNVLGESQQTLQFKQDIFAVKRDIVAVQAPELSTDVIQTQGEILKDSNVLDNEDYGRKFFVDLAKRKFTFPEEVWDPTMRFDRQDQIEAWINNGIIRLPHADNFSQKVSFNKVTRDFAEVLESRNDKLKNRIKTVNLDFVSYFLKNSDLRTTLETQAEKIVKTMTEQEIKDIIEPYINPDLYQSGQKEIPLIRIMYSEKTGEVSIDKATDKYLAFLNVWSKAYYGRGPASVVNVVVDVYENDIPSNLKTELSGGENRYIVNEYVAEKENNLNFNTDVEKNAYFEEVFRRHLDLNEPFSKTQYKNYVDLYKQAREDLKRQPLSAEEQVRRERSFFTEKERRFLSRLDNIKNTNSVTNVFNSFKNDLRQQAVMTAPFLQSFSSDTNPMTNLETLFGLFTNFQDMLSTYDRTPNKTIVARADRNEVERIVEENGGITIKNGDVVTYKKGYQVAYDKSTELPFDKFKPLYTAQDVKDGKVTQAEYDANLKETVKKNLEDAMDFIYDHSHSGALLENVGVWVSEGKVILDPSSTYVTDFATATMLQLFAEQDSVMVWENDSPKTFIELETKFSYIRGEVLFKMNGLAIESDYGSALKDIVYVNNFSNLPDSSKVKSGKVYIVRDGVDSGVYNYNTFDGTWSKKQDRKFLSDYYVDTDTFLENITNITIAEMYGVKPYTDTKLPLLEQLHFEDKTSKSGLTRLSIGPTIEQMIPKLQKKLNLTSNEIRPSQGSNRGFSTVAPRLYLGSINQDGNHLDLNAINDLLLFDTEKRSQFTTILKAKVEYDLAKKLGKEEVDPNKGVVNIEENSKLFREYLQQNYSPMTKSWNGMEWNYQPLSDADQQELIRLSNQNMELHESLSDSIENELGYNEFQKIKPKLEKQIVWVPIENLVKLQEYKRDGLYERDANGKVVPSDLDGLVGSDEGNVEDLIRSVLERGAGLYQPIFLTYNDENGRLLIKDGNHRFSAMLALGMKQVPVVMGVTKTDAVRVANLVENLNSLETRNLADVNYPTNTNKDVYFDFMKKQAEMSHLGFVKPEIKSPQELNSEDWVDVLGKEAVTGPSSWPYLGRLVVVNAKAYLPKLFDKQTVKPTYAPNINTPFNAWAAFKLSEVEIDNFYEKENRKAAEQEKLRVDNFILEKRKVEQVLEDERANFEYKAEAARIENIKELKFPDNRDLFKVRPGKKRYFLINPSVNIDTILKKDVKELPITASGKYLLLSEEDYLNLKKGRIGSVLNQLQPIAVDIDETIANGEREFNANVESIKKDDVLAALRTERDAAKVTGLQNVYNEISGTVANKLLTYTGKLYLNEVIYFDKYFRFADISIAQMFGTEINVSDNMMSILLDGINNKYFKATKTPEIESDYKLFQELEGHLAMNYEPDFIRRLGKVATDMDTMPNETLDVFVESLKQQRGPMGVNNGQNEIVDFVVKLGNVIEKRRLEGVSINDYKENKKFIDSLPKVDINPQRLIGQFESYSQNTMKFDAFIKQSGIYKWFDGPTWTKALRTAMILYTQNTETTSIEAKLLLNRFIYDFGLLDFDKQVKAPKKVTYTPIKTKYLPTYYANVYEVLTSTGAAGEVNFFFQTSGATQALGWVIPKDITVAPQITGFITSEGNKVSVDSYNLLVNAYDYRLSNIAIHELNHLLLRNKQPGLASFDLSQDYLNKVIKIIDYIKSKGNDIYKDFIGMLAPSYVELYNQNKINLDLNSYEITDLKTGQKKVAFYVQNNSIEEEAVGELIALNIVSGGNALINTDPVLKSMVDDARKNFVAAIILNKGADIKFDQTVRTTFAFNTDSNQAILNQLTNKVKTQPVEKKEPLKTRIGTTFTKWQEALQDSAAPMLRAFEYFGAGSTGDALIQQIRAATAITEQYILNGIFDKSGKQIAKPLYGPDFNGTGIFDFLVRQKVTNKFGKQVYKNIFDEQLSADFFLYNYLKHNVDSQNLKRKDVRVKDIKSYGPLSGQTIDNIILKLYQLTKNGKNATDITDVPENFNPHFDQDLINELLLTQVINQDEAKEIENQIRYYITIFGKYISVGKSGLNADKILPEKLLSDLDTYFPDFFNALTTQGAMDEAGMEKFFREYIESLKGGGASKIDINRIQSLLKQVRLFVQEVDMDTSKKFLKEMDAKYPEFAQKNIDLVKYFKVLFQKQFEAGLITEEAFNELNQNFPNYVPLSREYITGTASQGIMMRKMMSVRNPVMKRTGSDRVIEPLDITSARRTQVTNRAITINNLMNNLFDLWEAAGFPRDNPFIKDAEYFKAQRRTNIHDDISELVPQFSGETITFFRKGVAVKVTVGSGLARTLENLTMKTGRELGIVGDSIRKLAGTFKSLVTNWSIVFQVRNFFRDQFNSMILSANKVGEVQARTPVSLQLILSGGNLTKRSAPMLNDKEINKLNRYFKEFRQNGGMAASLYSHDEGISPGTFYSHSRVKNTNKVYRVFRAATSKLSKASMAVELLPRLSEYIASREAGKSIVLAINDAANVTTNFLKSGTFGRLLNTFGFTFLNANIQGKAHLLKRLVSPRSGKAWASFIIKFTVMGIAVSLMNELLYGGDDDYEDLPDYVKEQNFLVKIGNIFIKIPKGQILSEINYFANISSKLEDPDWNVVEAFNQIDPFNGFRSIFSPFIDVSTNTTWYGGQIVGTRYDGVRPENQYTERTSPIAKWLGQTIGYSPLKIDYLLNSYGGIFYDVFMSNNSIFAEDNKAGFEAFLADPRETNRWSNDFYNKYKFITWDKNDGDVIAQAQLRYMNRVRSNIQEIYAEMELINLDPTISDEEKKQQMQVFDFMIANAYKQAVKNVDSLGDTLQNYELSEESFDDDLLDGMKQIFGEEYALRNHNKDTYEKAMLLNKVGFGFEDFYKYYYNIRIADSLELRFKYINRLPLPKQTKEILYIQAGGRLKLEDKRRLKGFLSGKGLTEKQMNELLKINEETRSLTMSSFFTRQ